MKRFASIAVAVVVITAVASVLWLRGQLERPKVGAINDFALIDTSGRTVTLADYRGKWLLVFFGFTRCPDVCPTAMNNVSATLAAMGKRAPEIRPIFITIDPERDTPAVLKEYIAHFDASIVGLSGSPSAVASAAKVYGVYYRKRALGESYTMVHSTAFYLLSPDGRYLEPFAAEFDPQDMAKQLSAIMAQPTAEHVN